jgi:ubiquinone/menaquinone biosynthesis C-methylase UbiE
MAETPSQKDVFLNTEGDHWFCRNRLVQDHESSIPYDVECMLDFCSSPEILPINRILEIGCSDGYKLSLLASKLRSEGYGVDPSTKAIEHGMVAHSESNIKLMVGTADELPFDDNYFAIFY